MKIKQIRSINNVCNKNHSFCIYTDTDSIFEPIEPLFVPLYGSMDKYNDEEIIEKSKDIINASQLFINTSYSKYAEKFHLVNNHRWNIKQELIAKRAFWIGSVSTKTKQFEGVKKRYAQWIVNKAGRNVNKMDVKGIDTVRSDFPKAFRNFMSEILNDILHDYDKDELNKKIQSFKKNINKININDIMMPTGVKGINKYSTNILFKRLKGTPAHTKAIMNYNDMINMLNIHNAEKITNGMKVIWAYLRPNEYKLESIALKGYNDPPEIIALVEKYIDRDILFDRILLNKLNNFWLSLGWGSIVLNSNANKFFNFN